MASRIVDSLPASWFDCRFKQQVIDYLKNLPIDPEDRKTGLYDWCRLADCECTGEDFSEVTRVPAGEI